MQRHQHYKFILNQPQKICTSTQSHWKDKSVINNFHVYDKVQLKTETCEKTQEHENRHSANKQFARRAQLLAVASDDVYSLGRETFVVASWDLLVGRPKALVVASWELLARRPRTLVGLAMTSAR